MRVPLTVRKLLLGFVVVLVICVALYLRFHRSTPVLEAAYVGNRQVILWDSNAEIREAIGTFKYGDRLDVLAPNPDAAKRAADQALSAEGLAIDDVRLDEPTLENTFVAVLRNLGEMVHAEPFPGRRDRSALRGQIAIGALRYFLLKFTRNSVIAFDLQEALSFEGETGPDVQYAAVRARNILRKLEERGETVPDFAAELNADAMARQLAAEDSWQMLLAASKADSALERAVTAGEPAHMAKYAFQLAQAFNNFYHQYPVLQEQDRERKVFLLWMTDFFRRQLEKTAGILGIKIPAYM